MYIHEYVYLSYKIKLVCNNENIFYNKKYKLKCIMKLLIKF